MSQGRPGPLAALDHRNFRIYWIGQAISLVGVWMQQMAHHWVVANLTSSPMAVSLVSFVMSLPMIVLALYGGAVADRFDRRRILIVTQVALAVLALVYAGLLASGHISMTHVYFLAVGLGTVIAFDLPAQHALVPQLVPPEIIPHAIALNQALFHAARFLGPMLAGQLIALASMSAAFVANSVTYLAVIASLVLIRPLRPQGRPRGVGLEALREGLRYVGEHRDVRAIIGFTGLTTTFVFPFLIVFLALAVRTVYEGGEAAFGLAMSGSGLGAALGALCITMVAPEARGRTIVLFCGMTSLALLGASLVTSSWALAVFVTAIGFSVSLALGLGSTMIQVKVPEELRGRVMSLHTFMFTALMPSAALALGGVAERLGLRHTFMAMAAAYALFAIPWLLRAGLWRKDQGPT